MDDLDRQIWSMTRFKVMTAQEISVATGRAYSTVHRRLILLEARMAMVRMPNGGGDIWMHPKLYHRLYGQTVGQF